jgi:preprotein translocase subunit SecF
MGEINTWQSNQVQIQENTEEITANIAALQKALGSDLQEQGVDVQWTQTVGQQTGGKLNESKGDG